MYMDSRGLLCLLCIILVVLSGCAGSDEPTETTEFERSVTESLSDTATESPASSSTPPPSTTTGTQIDSTTSTSSPREAISVSPQFTSSGDLVLQISANTTFEQTDPAGNNPGEPYFVIEINGNDVQTTEQVERTPNGELEVTIPQRDFAGYTGEELRLIVRLMDEDTLFDDEIHVWENSITQLTPTTVLTETQTARPETSTPAERDTISPTDSPTLTPTPTPTPSPTPTATSTPSPTPTATPTPTPTATPTSSPTPTATPTPTPTPTPDQPGVVVSVMSVTDGDTIDILFQNGTEDTVRLLGVDAPETYGSTSPDEFEGVPDSAAGRDCLREEGQVATAYMQDRLAGESVRLLFDSQSDRRGSFDRLLAYVVIDGEIINYQLVSEGHARVYDSTFEQSDRFYVAEDDAQSSERGVWRCHNAATPTPTPETTATESQQGGAGELAVAQVHADASGNDHENENDEYIVFENTGGAALDLSGWTIADEADHTYYVSDGVSLGPGETITLYTGSGSDSSTELYWGSDSAIWNNGGDTIIVTDDAGSVILEYEYS